MRNLLPRMAMLLSFSTVSAAFAQLTPTVMNVTDVTPVTTDNVSKGWTSASSPYASGTSYTNHYGQTSAGAGKERVVTGFSVGSVNYSKIPVSGGLPFNKVVVKRHPSLPGTVINTLYEYTTASGVNNYFSAGYIGTLEGVINSFSCNRGSDNVFANAGSTQSNIERIDLILTEGVVCTDPAKQGILINERNGNDPFKVAAIINLSGTQEVSQLGNLFGITVAKWGKVGPSIITTVMSREVGVDAILRPKQNIDAQTVSGVFITLENMGIAAGTKIYGLSVFPNDVTSSMNLITLTDVPTTTAESDGGLDMMAGGGFFVENSILPVRFGNFIVTGNTIVNKLQWNVSNELNIKHYLIERSINGGVFESIASVSPHAGAGENAYSYTDNTGAITATVIAYRIKQVDNDNGFTYSVIVNTKKAISQTAISFYPNPVQDKMTINIPAKNNAMATVSFVTADGKIVHKENRQLRSGVNAVVFERLDRFAKGNYMLRITAGGQSYSEKFILQK